MDDVGAVAAKARMRAQVRAARAARTPVQRDDAAPALAAAVLALPELAGVPTVAAYASRPDEPGTAPLLAALRERGCTVLLPCVVGQELQWGELDDTGLSPAAFGIDEPRGPRRSDLHGVDVVIAPALAVDAHGHRLGQGGGYYDRALTDARVPVIALVHDDELVNEVPVEPHDLIVDIVVTPTRVVRVASAS